MTPLLLRSLRLAMLLLPLPVAGAAEAGWSIAEPATSGAATPRHPDPARWSWGQAPAGVVPTGDLTWAPTPFVPALQGTVRYIDFQHGDDAADGSQAHPWRHHPWDEAGQHLPRPTGPTTYVFRGGVTYRGELRPPDGSSVPVTLTSDPHWGSGPAVLSGAEVVSTWTQGADRTDIPSPDRVWRADLPYAPRCVWMTDGTTVTRIDLARTPHWSVTDPDDVKSGWYRFEQPNWWENNCAKYKISFQGHRAWEGVDRAHLTGRAEDYVGAIAHVEYGWVMGTPFPTKVEGFDAAQHAIIFQGIWLGDSENIITGHHYFLEDKPNFLDAPGEFWFDRHGQGGRLYLRLPADRDPRTVTVEAARHINLIECGGISHLHVRGLRMTMTNIFWDLEDPPWMHPDVNNACVRVRGSADDLQVDHNVFDHCGKAVRVDASGASLVLGSVLIADNAMTQTDHGAIEVQSHATGDVRILRNHLQLIGLRTFRQDHSHALVCSHAATLEVAGNILERTTGAGIFLESDGMGNGTGAVSRSIVHHNKAFQTLLSANDWGGIETNGAPYLNFDNVSGEPNGFWQGYNGTPGSARLGMAFYWDHGSAVQGFNLIAYGTSDDWTSKLDSQAGLYEASATVGNRLINSTIYRFWMASNWSPVGGRHQILGSIFADIGGMVIHHGPLKEDTVHAQVYPHETMAYGHNVFWEVPTSVERDPKGAVTRAFGVYEGSGVAYASPQAMAASFAAHPALASDVGTLATTPPLRDPVHHDFRPVAPGPAVGGGVRAFVPWILGQVVGEWHLRLDHAHPDVLLDDHVTVDVPYATAENPYQLPRYPLQGHHLSARDFGAAPLEDWCARALTLDGRTQYASLDAATMAAPFTYAAGKGQATAAGDDLVSPAITTQSVLIEVICRPTRGGGVILAHRHGAGYQLAVNHAGGITLGVSAGGPVRSVASGARLTDGQWHHVLAEWDHATQEASIYTDGVRTAHGPLALGAPASLANDGDLLLGKGPDGDFYAGALAYVRLARTTLAESKTSIEELYDWEMDGPFLRDFAGATPRGPRDAGALQHP